MSPHLWIEMPRGLDAHDVADRARLRGVGVAPASAFTADHNRTGGAMRVSIGAITDAKQLESALRLIASLVSHPRLSTATVV
ncbi:MAG TPA: hypothetical protein VF505_18355 [Thermoanaerobaculia bacterium]